MGPKSWDEHRLYVMKSLDDLTKEVGKVQETQAQIIAEIQMLKVKSSLWGGLAGAVPAIVIGVMAWWKM
jgi:hypothetical protein